jgi:hypothetical protein
LASFTQITPDTRASSVVCWLNSSSTAVSSSLFVGYSSNIHFDKSHTESELLAYFTGLSWLCFLFFTEVHEINALLGGCSHLSVCPYIKAQPLLYTWFLIHYSLIINKLHFIAILLISSEKFSSTGML